MKKGTPSRTAEHNAFVRACESAKKPQDRVCFDPYAKHFIPRRLSYIYAVPFFRRRLLSQWELFFPGVVNAILARTRFIDDQLRLFIDEGMEQLVVFGAGFDTRPWRFGVIAKGIPVFEIDHPDTQNPKNKILENIFRAIPGNFHSVPIDFENSSIQEKLLEKGYDLASKTFFVWEGVTYYLTTATVNDVLSFVGTRSGTGSRLSFDYFPPSVADGSCELPGAKTLAACLERFGERIVSGIAPEKLNSLMGKHGLVLEGNFARENYRRTYFKGPGRERPVSGLFHFAIARVES